MTDGIVPILDELKLREAPCHLWDPERLRIVWANPAGLSLFGSDTLFDLLDRTFDASEPGPGRIRTIAREITTGSWLKAELAFPSAGPNAKFSARCHHHLLPDGRTGVLVVGDEPAPRTGPEASGPFSEAFAALPIAVLIVEPGGRISGRNMAADEFVDGLVEQTLASLLGGSEKSKDLLARMHGAGTVSEVRSIQTRLGPRDVRVTARRVGSRGEAPGQAVLMLEDVTERRALERELSGRVPSVRSTGAGTPSAVSPRRPNAPASPPAAAKTPESDRTASTPAERPVEDSGVPPVIRKRLDELADSIVVLRNNEILHANARAIQLLGFATLSALKDRADIAQLIVAPTTPATIADATGQTLRIRSQLSQVPWVGGFATQAVISLAAETAPAKPAAASSPAPVEKSAPSVPAAEPPPARKAPEKTAPPPAEAWRPEDAELSAILDTASDGIVTLDDQGRIRSFSAGAEAIFGTPKAAVLGEPFAGLLTPETRKIFRDYLAALSDSGMAAVFNDGREVEAIAGPGKSLPLFLTISRFQAPAKPKPGQKPGFCAVVRDITQWKQTEIELRNAKEKAERTSAQKSEFLARISHELRTPLNAILGFSEVMRLERFGRIDNDKYRDYIADIHASGAHLLSLINDLLDLSKVEAGKLELNFTSVNLEDVTEHAMRLLADRAQQARVIMRRTFPKDLPNVVADLRSMRQIMLNLLSNAIKFTDPGGQVIVSARLNDAGELVLRVKDTGVGMTEDEIRDALEPFRRVTTDTRGDVEGTGLGLPLTRALTEANRAKFWITSEPGKGTLVEVTYPTTRVLAE